MPSLTNVTLDTRYAFKSWKNMTTNSSSSSSPSFLDITSALQKYLPSSSSVSYPHSSHSTSLPKRIIGLIMHDELQNPHSQKHHKRYWLVQNTLPISCKWPIPHCSAWHKPLSIPISINYVFASAKRFARVGIRSVKSFCFNLEHIACPCSLCVCRWCCWNCLHRAVEEASSCSGARKRLSWHMIRFFHQYHHALGITVSLVNLVSVRKTMNRFLTQWRKSRMRAVPL